MIEFLILIFTYLPSFIVHFLLLLSIGVFAATYFIPLLPNKLIIKNLSIALFVFSVYLEGGLAVTKQYEARMREWQEKIEVAEKKSKDTNIKVKYVYVDRVKKVKDVQVVVQEKIKDAAVNIDSQCKITKSSVEILNEAAKNETEKGVK